MVNKFLSDILGSLNSAIAMLIILVGMIAGGYAISNPVLGAMVGGGLGLLVATLFCGFLALVIDMRSALRQLVEMNRVKTPVQTV